MAYLDRSTMDVLGAIIRTEYASLAASPATSRQRALLFQYALAEAALEAERRSREARLRLRHMVPHLCSSILIDEVMADAHASMG